MTCRRSTMITHLIERGLMYLSANDGHIVAPIAGGTRSALPTTRAAFTSCTVSARMARRWLSSSSCAQICRLPVGSPRIVSRR